MPLLSTVFFTHEDPPIGSLASPNNHWFGNDSTNPAFLISPPNLSNKILKDKSKQLNYVNALKAFDLLNSQNLVIDEQTSIKE